MKRQPNWLWLGKTRTLAAVALMVGGALAAVAGVSMASTVDGEKSVSGERRAETAVVRAAAGVMKQNTPVNGDARAADEPPSRPAIENAVQASGRIELAKTQQPAARRESRTMLMEVTAYCACKICCGPNAQGITASGKRVTYNGGKFVAADTKVLPFGTKLVVPGYNNGRAVPVADRGGAIVGKKLDLYFPTHQAAREWGRQWVEVTVLD